MPLIFGSAFLAGALLSCLLPVSLLIAFAVYYVRSARRMPSNAVPESKVAAPDDLQSAPRRQFSDV